MCFIMQQVFDSHIHTKYSKDAGMEPYKLMKRAKKVGLTSIAITDHNQIKGALEAKKYEKEFNIEVIPGVERNTDIGDVIGLFINERIKSKQFLDVVDEIKNLGGLVVLPHPYRSHFFKHIAEVEEHFDFIEVWNARSSPKQNKMFEKHIMDFHELKTITMGSDSHFYNELGNVKIKFETDIDNFAFVDAIELTYSKKYNILRSIFKSFKN